MNGDPFASVQPRTRRAAPPIQADDPFASIAPRTKPAPSSFLDDPLDAVRRAGGMAMDLGRAVIQHPVETAKSIGKGLAQNAGDLLDMTGDPVRASQRILIAEGGDPKRAGARYAGALGMGLAPALPLAGLTGRALLFGEVAANAGIGAAQTPDDPAAGAILGAATTAIPSAVRGAKNSVKPLNSMTLEGIMGDVVDTPRNIPAVEMPQPRSGLSVAAAPSRYAEALDELAKVKVTPSNVGRPVRRAMSKPVDPMMLPENIAANEAIDSGRLTAYSTPDAAVVRRPMGAVATPSVLDDMQAALAKIGQRSDEVAQGEMANRMIDEGRTAPYSTTDAEVGGVRRRPADISQALEQEKATALAEAETARRADISAQAQETLYQPPKQSLPPTSETFPEGYQSKPTGATPAYSAVPDVRKANRSATADPTPVEQPVVTAEAPAADATVNRPAQPDTQAGMAPAEESYLNWRTVTDAEHPLGAPVLDRIKATAARIDERLKAERGYQSFDAQQEAALKTDAIKAITDDPLSIDRNKLQQLSGGQILAVKEVADQNVKMIEMISRQIADGNLSPDDLLLAQQRIQQLSDATDEAYATVVGESARAGRNLGILRNVAKSTTDPAFWEIQAKRVLGDRPITDEIMLTIRRMAKEAGEACGG